MSCRIKICFSFLLTHLSTAFSITTLETIFLGSPIWSCSLRSCFEKCHIQYNLHRRILIHVSGLQKKVFQVDILYMSQKNPTSFSDRHGGNFSMTGLIKTSYPTRLLLSCSLLTGTISFTIIKNISFQKMFTSWSMDS